MFDVAVIGAGPAGSRIARSMAEQGFRTVVFDKKQKLNEPVCCTGIVSREFIDLYKIDTKVIYSDVNGASIYSPSGKLLHVQRQAPQASILNRPAFNAYLAKMAMEKGVEYRLDSRVCKLETNKNSIALEVESTKNGGKRFEVRAVVIAGGFGSRLTEMAGLGKAGDFAMGVQAEVEAPDLKEVQVFLGDKTAPGFFGWLVPTDSGKALAGLMTRRNTSSYMRDFLSTLEENGRILKKKPVLSFAGVALREQHRTSNNRVLVIGGAAGQVKPVTGGGIYFGMLCADIAAKILTEALEADDLTAKRLANYDREWRKVLGRELKLSYWSRRFYERLNDRHIEKIFDIIQKNGIDKTLLESDDVQFDWHGKIVLKLLRFSTLIGLMKSLRNPITLENNKE